MEVGDLNRGQRFIFVSPRKDDEVYEYVDYSNGTHCIKRVMYLMDGRWCVDTRNGPENCNPYAEARLVEVGPLPKELQQGMHMDVALPNGVTLNIEVTENTIEVTRQDGLIIYQAIDSEKGWIEETPK